MLVRKAIWLPGLLAVLALALAACGGSDPTATRMPTPESADLSAEEEEYLGAVRDAQLLTVSVFQGFGQVFSQTYPVREALLAALLQAGVGTPFIGNLAALEELDPPDRFTEDHRVWLEAVREQLRLDTEAAEAVQEGDLVRFSQLNGQLDGINVSARLALSPAFCRSTIVDRPADALCTPLSSVSIGEYEIEINNLWREHLPEIAIASSTIAFRLSLTPEEMGEVLPSLAVGYRNTFQGIESALGTITPPEGTLADHERMKTYVSEVLSIIQEAGRLSGDGDFNGARLELQRLDTAYCNARQSFESADFKVAVAIFFAGDPGDCGGAPY